MLSVWSRRKIEEGCFEYAMNVMAMVAYGVTSKHRTLQERTSGNSATFYGMHAREYPQEELQKWRLWSHVTFVMITVFIVLGYIAMKDFGLTADEGWHANQITMFVQGNWAMDSGLTTIPGFHAIVAFVAMIVGEHSLGFLRFVSMIISLAGMVACRCILLRTTPHLVSVRLWQVALLPILFPFFFLLYTDVTALTLVLWGIVFFLDRRYATAFILIGLSVLVRQMNIIWFLFVIIAWLMQEHRTTFLPLSLHHGDTKKIMAVLGRIRFKKQDQLRIALVLSIILLFVIFVILNGGVAIGDQGAHPFPGIHLGNIFFMSGIFTVLFFPHVLSTLPSIARHIRHTPWVIPALVALFIVYMITAWNSHWYNQDIHSYFIHNRLLAFTTLSPWTQVGVFGLMALGIASFMTTRLQRPWTLLLHATILCLLPSWLIEQRYYIIPYVLFLLFRVPSSLRIERSMVLYEALLCGILFWIIIERSLFL